MNIHDINTLPAEEVRLQMDEAKLQERVHFEFRHRRADGSIRDVEVFSSKIVVNGKALLHSIVHDVTERKETEEALRVSGGRLQKAEVVACFGSWELIPGAEKVNLRRFLRSYTGWKAHVVHTRSAKSLS